MKNYELRQKDIDRFWSKVDIGDPDECWEWQASRNEWGYGRFGLSQPNFQGVVRANRFAYEANKGQRISEQIHVLHKCDNPPCCNPNHLFLGSALDNMQDKVVKGRARGQQRGEENNKSKLTRAAVVEILDLLSSGEAMVNIAEIYGVDPMTIWKIKHGITWKHVTREEEDAR